MLRSYQRLLGSTVASMMRVGEAWGEIAALSPQVVALRTDAALSAIRKPTAVPDGEPVRMVAEKIDAVAAGVVAATLESGLALGRSLTGQSGPFDAAVDIAMAGLAPIRGRLRSNVERLGGGVPANVPLAAE